MPALCHAKRWGPCSVRTSYRLLLRAPSSSIPAPPPPLHLQIPLDLLQIAGDGHVLQEITSATAGSNAVSLRGGKGRGPGYKIQPEARENHRMEQIRAKKKTQRISYSKTQKQTNDIQKNKRTSRRHWLPSTLAACFRSMPTQNKHPKRQFSSTHGFERTHERKHILVCFMLLQQPTRSGHL